MAVLALVAALVGTAVAGPSATSSSVKRKTVNRIARKQATKRIIKLAPGLSVKHAVTAPPEGAAGGDLAGDYPNPAIQSAGIRVSMSSWT